MKHPLFLALLAFIQAHGSVAQTVPRFDQSARVVDRFDFLEITLTLPEPPPGNPFLDASMQGVFQQVANPEPSTSMTPWTVDGFCDDEGGRVFRLRFMPMVAGKHTYSVSFRSGATEWKHVGKFTARTGRRRGLVVRDPEYPTHFKWSGDGRHFFYHSTTAYWLLGFRDDSVIRESLDRLDLLGVNRIRVALSGRTRSGMRWKEPMIVSNDDFQYRLEPWPAARPHDIEDPGYDVTRFN
ncbi:MAG: DUF5060 domain-containing protein, partial [Verrucomicrobiales bacterium]|nr:DUF5060 domain-containing protein [Verrucomicrobiales bacterium]